MIDEQGDYGNLGQGRQVRFSQEQEDYLIEKMSSMKFRGDFSKAVRMATQKGIEAEKFIGKISTADGRIYLEQDKVVELLKGFVKMMT